MYVWRVVHHPLSTTPAERTAILSALRDHLAAETGEEAGYLRRSTLETLAANAMKDGFESATAWIDGAGLGDADAETMANGIKHWRTGPDTGKWIEWMGGKLPAEILNAKVIGMMNQWTSSDYKATGQWLNEASEGPAKVAAVRSYAHTLAPYDPAAAEQWAKTLPPGKEREELLEAIGKLGQPEAAAE